MPGLTNRRRAIQEGINWAKSKAKGYKYGGPVLNQLGKAEALLPKIAKKAKKKSRKV